MLLLLLTLACRVEDGADSAEPPPWSAPDEMGPYGIGRETITFVDVRGKELTMEVWYPAVVDPEDEPDPYEPTVFAFDAHEGAPPDPRGAPYPLAAFSHGNTAIRFQSAYLMEHLASHGWVVVAPDHPHNTLLDDDPDRTLEVVVERPGDIIHSVDEVYSLAEEGHESLAGMVDPDGGYVMMGHSFGSWTTLVVGGGEVDLTGVQEHCEGRGGIACRILSRVEVDDPDDPIFDLPSDPRVIATVPMSPGVWYGFTGGGEGLASVTKPLVLAGTRDTVLSYDEEALPVYEHLSEPKVMASFIDGGHYVFTHICMIAPGLAPDCGGPDEGWIDEEAGLQISKTIVAAWLGQEVKGDADYSPWLGEAYAEAHPELAWGVWEP
ncbi:MAG: hypothetical protein H6740_15650 [Alphaproteobacteria bacterium]|nr:hypothetical protein [Alphaproteobacteria bacterium]